MFVLKVERHVITGTQLLKRGGGSDRTKQIKWKEGRNERNERERVGNKNLKRYGLTD